MTAPEPRSISPSPPEARGGGLEVHTILTLTDADRASREGIPCTSPARTLVDLGDVANRRAGAPSTKLSCFASSICGRSRTPSAARAAAPVWAFWARVLADYTGPALTS
jgi:hypothetical protein